MRDAALAERLRLVFARHHYATTWAAALPEAIAAMDRHFPDAVACTLRGHTPSLMDLETILAYEVLGHPWVSMPQTPIWALTLDPGIYPSRIETLQLPIRLAPVGLGLEAFVEEIVRSISSSASFRRTALDDSRPVLLALERVDEGQHLVRYLRAHGISARSAAGPRETLRALRSQPVSVLVSEAFDGRRDGGSYWREVEERWGRLPVLFVASSRERLARLSPLAFPRGTAGALSRPIAAGNLTASLRRLLRVTAAPEATASPWAAHAV
jgi:hypothetical protein